MAGRDEGRGTRDEGRGTRDEGRPEAEKPSTFSSFASALPSPLPPRPSSRARYLDSSGYDLLPQLLDSGARAVGNQPAIAIVVDVTDAALLQAERIDPALEGMILHPL